MTLVKAKDIKEDSGSIVFDFKDVAAEAQTMLNAARVEAERIVGIAKAETEQKQEEVFAEAERKGMEQGRKKGYEDAFEPARKEGYEKGYAEALAKVKDRFEQHIHEPIDDLKAVLNYFDQNKKRLLWEAEQSFVQLAVKLADKVIKKNIELHPEMIKDTVIAALETVSQKTNVVIRVSPEDFSVMEDLKGDLEYILGRFSCVKFNPDINVIRGGCIVLTERGKVDAQIEVQLDRIARDILETNVSLDIGEEDFEQRVNHALISQASILNETDIEDGQDSIDPGEIVIDDQHEEVITDGNIAEDIQEVQQEDNSVEDPDDNTTQLNPERDQATELRKQMEDNNEQDIQE